MKAPLGRSVDFLAIPPFSFRGTFSLPGDGVAIKHAVFMLAAYLSAEGATDVKQSNDAISFQGVFKRTFSPLQTIARGSVKLAQRDRETDVFYSIRIDPLQFLLPLLVLGVGLLMTLLGAKSSHGEGARVATYFGAAMLALTVSWAFVIHIWFSKWLRRKTEIVLQPPSQKESSANPRSRAQSPDREEYQ
jgi:hypothetical protein